MRKIFLWLLGGTVLAFGALCGLGFLALSSSHFFQESVESIPPAKITMDQRREIEKTMHLRFPRKSRIMYLLLESGWQDDSIQLKLRMTVEELGSFLQNAAFKGADWSRLDPQFPALRDDKKRPGWTPSQVKKGRTSQISLPDAEFIDILIDDTAAREKDVYLHWFEI